jgi:predicted RNA binding protein YcfA (HicA-like mRNA interferase family)
MTNFPSISGKQLLVALQKSGFELVRIKGGHHFIRHADGRSTVVPVHSNESIGPGLLAKRLRDCDTSRDQLHQLL